MTSNHKKAIRIGKRLSEAAGYLDLGMPQHALRCIENLGDLGPFTVPAEMIRAAAAQMENRFDDAAHSFEMIARFLPSPQNKPAWLAVSDYYRQAGKNDLAIDTLACARGAAPPAIPPAS